MATLTADQLGDIQADLGISNDGTVFTDAELQRNYTRASGNYDKAVVISFRQLLAQANKLHTYSVASASENLKEVRDNLRDSLTYWEERVLGQSQQIKIVGLRGIPPRWKDEP